MQTCPHPSFVTCEIHSVYAAPRAMTCVPPASNAGLRDVGNPVRGVRGAGARGSAASAGVRRARGRSLTLKKANKRRKLVLTPVFDTYVKKF